MKALIVLISVCLILLAGCLGALEEPVEAASADPGGVATGPAEARVEAIAYDGSTPTGACAWAVVIGTCEYVVWPEHAFTELDTDGKPALFQAEVAWDATSPATEDLAVYLLVERGGAWYYEESYPDEQGRSPLKLDWDLAEFEGSKVALYVTSMRWSGAFGAGGGYGASQPFSVEGTLTLFEPAETG